MRVIFWSSLFLDPRLNPRLYPLLKNEINSNIAIVNLCVKMFGNIGTIQCTFAYEGGGGQMVCVRMQIENLKNRKTKVKMLISPDIHIMETWLATQKKALVVLYLKIYIPYQNIDVIFSE